MVTKKSETLYFCFNWDWDENCFDEDGVSIEEKLYEAKKYSFYMEIEAPINSVPSDSKCLGKFKLTR
jgi:hypothetical protein